MKESSSRSSLARKVEMRPCRGFVQHDRLEEIAGLFVLRRERRAFRLVELQRRNADLLAGFEPVLRVGAFAVHPHLAFANDALDVAEREPGKARLEEPIEPHVGFVARDRDRLHTGGDGLRRWWLGARRPFVQILAFGLRLSPAAFERWSGTAALRSTFRARFGGTA